MENFKNKNIFVTRSDGGTYLSEDKSDLVLYSRHGLVLSFDTDEVPAYPLLRYLSIKMT